MLCLVRHGQTPYNAERRLQGQLDIPLSDTGRAQAHSLGERLKNEGARFDALYCSTLQRAKETAEIVGGYLGLVPRTIEGIEEIAFGCFQGHTFEECSVLFPEAYAVHMKYGTSRAPHGGETDAEVLRRAALALLALPEAGKGRALVVSHGAVIGCLRAAAKGLPLSEMPGLIPGNAELIPFDEETLMALKGAVK